MEVTTVQMVRKYPDGTQNPKFAQQVSKMTTQMMRRNKSLTAEQARENALSFLLYYSHTFRDVSRAGGEMNNVSGMIIVGKCGKCSAPVFAYYKDAPTVQPTCKCFHDAVMQPMEEK